MGLGGRLKGRRSDAIQNGGSGEVVKLQSCDVIFLLDESGSMGSYDKQAMREFNHFVDEQEKVDATTRMTLGLFADTFNVVKKLAPIGAVPRLDGENYHPHGCTVLLDAIGQSIGDTMTEHTASPADRPDRTLFVILSDGGENGSRQFSRPIVKSMIDRARNVFGWEFIVIAIGRADAAEIAKDLGIDERLALSAGDHIAGAFEAISQATEDYRRDGEIKLLGSGSR